MDLGLNGRVAIVTGASKGIGKAIALGLAKEGVRLVLFARTASTLEATASEIREATGVEVLGLPTDLRDRANVESSVRQAVAAFGPVHILVNNAGGPIRRPQTQLGWPDSDWMDDVDTKTLGMLRVVATLMPHMPNDGTGRIINISGISGTSVLYSALTHGLNNSAMNHITGYLAGDLAAARITVNTVIPGLISTEWREQWAGQSARDGGQSRDQFLADVCQRWGIVSGRWGTMEEVADLVTFLASDRASYINGAKIPVDGGYMLNVRN